MLPVSREALTQATCIHHCKSYYKQHAQQLSQILPDSPLQQFSPLKQSMPIPRGIHTPQISPP